MFGMNLFWIAMTVQALGLGSVAIARVAERSRLERWAQRFFVVALFVVSAATMGLLLVENANWLICGTTLAVMVVGATFEIRDSAAYDSLGTAADS